jgi:hypothetical protein
VAGIHALNCRQARFPALAEPAGRGGRSALSFWTLNEPERCAICWADGLEKLTTRRVRWRSSVRGGLKRNCSGGGRAHGHDGDEGIVNSLGRRRFWEYMLLMRF